jgi:hypothetical protein
VSEFDELRALVREVIRDVLPAGLPVNGPPVNGHPVTETVDLSTDEDLAVFVARLLDVDPGEREELQSGRKRFTLARRMDTRVPVPAPAPGGAPVRRVESGAVTEALVKQAAQAGERLVLGRGAVLTPLARDRARASGVEIVKER